MSQNTDDMNKRQNASADASGMRVVRNQPTQPHTPTSRAKLSVIDGGKDHAKQQPQQSVTEQKTQPVDAKTENSGEPSDDKARKKSDDKPKKQRMPFIIDDDEDVPGNDGKPSTGFRTHVDEIDLSEDEHKEINWFGITMAICVALCIVVVISGSLLMNSIVSGVGLVGIIVVAIVTFAHSRRAARKDELLSQAQIEDEVTRYKRDLASTLIGYNVRDYTPEEIDRAAQPYREMLEVENTSIASVDPKEMLGVLKDEKAAKAYQREQKKAARKAKREAKSKKKSA